MGRELKRVPLDFKWQLNTRWEGYIQKDDGSHPTCTSCGGNGMSPGADRMHKLWYGYIPFKPEDNGSVPLLASSERIRASVIWKIGKNPEFYGKGEAAIVREAQRMCDHWNRSMQYHLNAEDIEYLRADGLLDGVAGYKEGGPIPTPLEVNEYSATHFLGLSSSAQWALTKLRGEKEGWDPFCPDCKGQGVIWVSEEAKANWDAWERTEPPTGEGYQIWETVTEGSPISPVFATPEELARHMENTRWGADEGTSYETWMRFITGPGWAPSNVAIDGVVMSGVEAVTRE